MSIINPSNANYDAKDKFVNFAATSVGAIGGTGGGGTSGGGSG